MHLLLIIALDGIFLFERHREEFGTNVLSMESLKINCYTLSIYISPEKQDKFIATLQALNPNITIKNTPYVE